MDKDVPIIPKCDPVEGTLPTRVDQRTPCPKCGSWKCPSVGGSRERISGRRRYRTCQDCGHSFTTIEPVGSSERVEF